MILKENVFEINNLELAFRRLKFGSRHLHKQLYWTALKDVEPFRKDYFEFVIEKLTKTNRVDNHSVIRAYIPKKGGFVRPITYLGFEPLLIYQAITNKLAEYFYKEMSKNYNKITFGNHFNADPMSDFVFMAWKKRWKNYQEVSKKLIERRNYNYVVDFDIASFYDSIDHKLLTEALKGSIDDPIIQILMSVLRLSHSDFKHIHPGSGSGIPQGPQASTVLAEIFLHHYIDQYFVKQIRNKEIAYIRYADDIRIFSPQKEVARKFITVLDLLCRNSGLIPQASKVGINFYEDSRELIDQDVKKFSQIQKQYKASGKLKSKDSRKALNLVKEMLKSGEIEKTKFSFYIYKLGKDDELRDLILANIVERYEFSDQMLSYLKKHYSDDEGVTQKLFNTFIVEDNFFLDYPIYSFLSQFRSQIEFDSHQFLTLFHRKDSGKWLSKITLIDWALQWNQKEVLDSLNPDEVENILLKRRLIYAQNKLANNLDVKRQRALKLLNINHPDTSFKSISLLWEGLLFEPSNTYSLPKNTGNPIVERVFFGRKYNSIASTLNQYCEETLALEALFCEEVFADENEFEQLSVLCNFMFGYYQDKSYRLFIDSLDQFNHIMIERLFSLERGSRPLENFGALLKNESFLSTEMIYARDVLSEIHSLRNGELHPKDINTGKFYPSQKPFEQRSSVMEKLMADWLNAVEEIAVWYKRQYFSS